MVDKNLIIEVKQKKIFSEIPDSLIEKALLLNKNNIKETRAFLRKYLGVFLTNRVLKPKNILDYDSILNSHISSKKRNYVQLFDRIAMYAGSVEEVIDLGCGVNGFSYPFIQKKFGSIKYLGVEASGQLCKLQNSFFEKQNFNLARVFPGDLMDLKIISEILLQTRSKKLILLFQVIDSLEGIQKNLSKTLLLEVSSCLSKEDIIVLSNSLKSISGRERFKVKRAWLDFFLAENFNLLEKFQLFDEEFFVLSKK